MNYENKKVLASILVSEWIIGWVSELVSRWTDGWMDGLIYGWVDRWVDWSMKSVVFWVVMLCSLAEVHDPLKCQWALSNYMALQARRAYSL
jgi:hypothetical protein